MICLRMRQSVIGSISSREITDLSVMDAITGTVTENVCQAFRDVYQLLGFEVDNIIVDLINEGDEEEDEEIGPNIKF